MRSIDIVILDSSESDIVDFLSTLASPFWIDSTQRLQWKIPALDHDNVLFVYLCNLDQQVVEKLERFFNKTSFVRIAVDITSRIDGTEDIKWLVKNLGASSEAFRVGSSKSRSAKS